MLRVKVLVAGLLAAASSSPAWSQAANGDKEAALFGARESASGISISPNGQSVVYVAPARGGTAVAFVANVATGDTKPFLNSGAGAQKLRWCAFVTDQRLVCSYGGIVSDAGLLVPFQRLIALNTDGSGMKELGTAETAYDAGYHQTDGEIIDWLPGQGGQILMSRNYAEQIGTTGSHVVRQRSGIGVDRINTVTLASSRVEQPRPGIGGYLSDGLGNVRLMWVDGADDQKVLSGKQQYSYRAKGSRDWKKLTDFVEPDDFQPLAVDGSTDSLYFLKPLNGRQALYRLPLTDSTAPELVASNPQVDIDDVIRSANGQRVIGYTYVVDKRQVEYFDPEYKALAQALSRALPKLPIIRFEGASDDGNRVLMYAGSDNDPGRYFIFDKKLKKLEEILLVRPDLEGHPLATVQTVSVKAADGTPIPAYLTIPPGKEAKNLPAVVLPHGGPSSRDEWGFDWLAQYLASKGYAVLQPNYRGSAGFGDAWMMQNGFKSWRTSIGDVAASARWLAAEGIADPKRMAIVGWSYGGYAALQTAATEPGLFKAVAAIAPVTDPAMLKEEASGYTNSRMVADFIGSGQYLIDGSPLKHAAAIKAPVLLVHGDMDLNVGVTESDKMESALKAAGTPVEFLRYKGLDHQLADGAARTEMLTKLGQLLDRTIGH